MKVDENEITQDNSIQQYTIFQGFYLLDVTTISAFERCFNCYSSNKAIWSSIGYWKVTLELFEVRNRSEILMIDLATIRQPDIG